MMSIWLSFAVIYVLFLAWYYNWSGPVKSEELENILQGFANSSGVKHTDVDVIRDFLRNDDGKEFIMQNFVKLQKGLVTNPVTGESSHASTLLSKYVNPFTKALLMRGGHPVFVARKVGGYIDSWEACPDQMWDATAMMRYRSRLDLLELASDPRFADIHIFKTTAIEKTANYPVQLSLSFFIKPGFYVPILLLLVASLVQCLLTLFRPSF